MNGTKADTAALKKLLSFCASCKTSSPSLKSCMVRLFIDKRIPELEYIGEGRARTAFRGESMCIKVARNASGQAQNRAERDISSLELMCFTKTFTLSEDSMVLAAELVQPADDFTEGFQEDDLAKILGVEEESEAMMRDLAAFLQAVSDAGSTSVLSSMLKAPSKAQAQLINAILSPQTPAQQSAACLAQFCASHPKDFIPCDVANQQNWGFAERSNSIVPVLLDYGFISKKRISSAAPTQ